MNADFRMTKDLSLLVVSQSKVLPCGEEKDKNKISKQQIIYNHMNNHMK